ncbi:hypothetical protein M1D51_11030 [Arthrobacter sp. R3-55]
MSGVLEDPAQGAPWELAMKFRQAQPKLQLFCLMKAFISVRIVRRFYCRHPEVKVGGGQQGDRQPASNLAGPELSLALPWLGENVFAAGGLGPFFRPFLQDGLSRLFRLCTIRGFSGHSDHSIRCCFIITIPTFIFNASCEIIGLLAKPAGHFSSGTSGWDGRSLLA